MIARIALQSEAEPSSTSFGTVTGYTHPSSTGAAGAEWTKLFKCELTDLGETHAEFSGIFAPTAEVGAARRGVTSYFLEDSEKYYQRNQSFAYWKDIVEDLTLVLPIQDAKTIVEFGCGFGNATLPLLDQLPNARVVATDISPKLIAIMRDLLHARGLSDRCFPVAMDAHNDYIHAQAADLVFGSAILHHLADPSLFIQRSMTILKPGGTAVFYEPMEGGMGLVRLCFMEIAREAHRRGIRDALAEWAGGMAKLLEPQILGRTERNWGRLDDKWAFPKSYLERLATEAGADLITFPVHTAARQFQSYFRYLSGQYKRRKTGAWRTS